MEAIAEFSKPIPPQLKPFTSETAREASLLRWKVKPEVQVEVVKPSESLDEGEMYRKERIKTVRAQLARVDGLLLKSKDPQELDRLASAASRLAEQERQLAGRPLPGSLRPKQERAPRSTSAEPSAPE